MQSSTRTGKAAGLVDHLGRSINGSVNGSVTDLLGRKDKTSLHPLDDPAAWARNPPYQPPSDVTIAEEQRKINDIYGTTRNGEPIMKLVWSGDRDYWFQFYTKWDATGRPTAPPERWPIIRYKILRDSNGKKVRNVFPPRWLILTRIEREQYAHAWKDQSYVYAPDLSQAREFDLGNGQVRLEASPVYKQIRPDTPPKEMWVWFATIKRCNGHCCVQAGENKAICYGKYARPSAIHEALWNQKRADDAAGFKPFEKLEYSSIQGIEDEHTGYELELRELQADAQVYIANPMALLGIGASAAMGIDTPQAAEKFAKEYFDRQIDSVGSKT